jgi:DNA-binding response OmpR family regulator
VLPVAPAPPEEGTEPARRETASAGGSETILLVEDDSSVREMAAVILKRFGYQVVAAPDGQSALARLHDRSLAIDVTGRHGVLESGVRLLSKPFTPQALAAAVRSALDGK